MRHVWDRGPAHVDFNVTNGCNLACSHCHSSSGDKLPQELDLDEIKAAVTELHAMGVLTIAFAGGEPFIRKDMIRILEHACSLPGWRVSVISNGMFFHTDEVVEELKERCPGLVVNVSLDGSSPAGFHLLRRQVHRPDADPGPLFARVVAGIERIAEAGFENSVNFTLTRPTLEDTVGTYRFVTGELGAGAMVAIKFFPGGYGKAHREAFDLPYAVWGPAFVDLTRQKLAGDLASLQVSVPAPWEFYLPLIEAGIDLGEAERAWGYASPLHEQGFASHFSLGEAGGLADLSVAADGRVYPSVLYVGSEDACCGNVRGSTLADIWRTSPVLEGLRALSSDGVMGACSSCALRGTCGGGSRARAFSLGGRLDGPDSACPLIGGTQEALADDAPALTPRAAPHPSPAVREPVGDEMMRVLGVGASAIRIYPLEDGGCEVRGNGRIVECGRGLADLLLSVTDGDTATALEQMAAFDPEGHPTGERAAALAELLKTVEAPADLRAGLSGVSTGISEGDG